MGFGGFGFLFGVGFFGVLFVLLLDWGFLGGGGQACYRNERTVDKESY